MEADTVTRRLVPGWIPVFPVKWELNQWWAAASMPTQCLRRRRQQLWGPTDSGLHYHLNLLWVTDYHSPSTALFQHRLRSFQAKTWCNLFLFTNQSFLTDNHWMLLQLDVCEEWIALNDILGLWEHFALISERHAFPTVLLWAQAQMGVSWQGRGVGAAVGALCVSLFPVRNQSSCFPILTSTSAPGAHSYWTVVLLSLAQMRFWPRWSA